MPTLTLSSRRFLFTALVLFGVVAHARVKLDLEGGDTENLTVQWNLAGALSRFPQIDFADTLLFNHHVVRWFELVLIANDRRIRLTPSTTGTVYDPATHRAQDYAAEILVAGISLSGTLEKSDFGVETSSWAAGVRLLGLTARSTSLTVRGGQRSRFDHGDGQKWMNPFYEAEAQVYLTEFLGATASYRRDFPGRSNFGEQFAGNERSLGGFIEFDFVRVFARFANEDEWRSPWNDDVLRVSRSEVDLGLRVAF